MQMPDHKAPSLPRVLKSAVGPRACAGPRTPGDSEKHFLEGRTVPGSRLCKTMVEPPLRKYCSSA